MDLIIYLMNISPLKLMSIFDPQIVSSLTSGAWLKLALESFCYDPSSHDIYAKTN